MKDQSISQRLIIGFGLILAMIVGVVIIAQLNVSAIKKNLNTVNEINSVKQRYAINFRGSVHDRAIELRDVVLVDNISDAEKAISTIETLAKFYANSAGPLDNLIATGKEVTNKEIAILDSIKQIERETLPIIDRVIQLRRSGLEDQAHSLLMGTAKPNFITWLARINQFIDLQEAKNQAIGSKVSSTAKNFLWFMLGALLISMILGVFVARWAMSSMKPLKTLTNTMHTLANGETNLKIPSITRKDEIGDIARAVEVFRQNSIERKRLEKEAEQFQKQLDAKLKQTEEAFEAAAEKARQEQKTANTIRDNMDKDRAIAERDRQNYAEEQSRVVEQLANALQNLANGDLTHRLDTAFPSDYEALRSNFNGAMNDLESAMRSISYSAKDMANVAVEISSESDQLLEQTNAQMEGLTNTSKALDNLTASITKNAQSADDITSAASVAKNAAEKSGKVVLGAVAAMDEISNSSQEINKIIGVIEEIAFQTNLLALNAGVEAARAGESGRGFAVVATEVRALAQRSAQAAEDIKELISASSNHVNDGVTMVTNSGEALENITQRVEDIVKHINVMTSLASSQSDGIAQTNNAVLEMDRTSQKNVRMVERSTSDSRALVQKADQLTKLVARFKVSNSNSSIKHEGTFISGRFRQAS